MKYMMMKNQMDLTKDTKLEKQKALINGFMFVSPLTRDLMRLHCTEIANQETFDELENLCKNYILTKMHGYNKLLEEAGEKSRTSENVIQRIQHYLWYAEHKQSPKMRMTKKEYEHAMSRLSDQEKSKVDSWVADNGGLDKYMFSVYNAG